MKLIVVSMDALIFEDLEILLKKPTFQALFADGAHVKRLRSVYPTLTYPCHTTMVTGCLPHRHGITNNTEELAGVCGLPWLFEHKNVRCPDLFDACHAAGLTTASVGWPVTGNHPSIDWLLDECWPDKESTLEAFKTKILETGTNPKLYDDIIEPLMELRIKRKNPDSSYFNTKVACEIIRRYKPDLLMLHVGNLDSYRHQSGVFSPLTNQGLEESEAILAMIESAVKEAGIWDETNIVITADHGQLNVTRTVHLNRLLAQEGYIQTDEYGNVTNWEAWCHPMGMSAKIQLRNPEDKYTAEKVRSLLGSVCSDGLWGVEKVFTKEEIASAEGLDGQFAFILEGDGTTCFDEQWIGVAVTPKPMGLTGPISGNHGYHPDKGPRPTFLACGPAFRKNVILDNGRLIDTAPTYAVVLGTQLPNSEGRVLTELLNL